MTADTLLDAALAVAGMTRRRVRALFKRAATVWDWAALARPVFDLGETLLTRILRDGQLQAWTTAGRSIFESLGLRPADVGRPPGPPTATLLARPGDPTPPYRLTAIESAADFLRSLRAVTPEEFAGLDEDARRTALTVARQTRVATVERVRDAVADAIAKGKTLNQVRPELADALETSRFSDAQIEALYRTYYGRAQAAGQQTVLNNPMVRDEFPYLLYSATHDRRVRPHHLALEAMGLWNEQGDARTAVYRADDPFWDEFYPPWEWNCRCAVIPLSIEDAAARGALEPIVWLRTGQRPTHPEYVWHPPFFAPVGFAPSGRRIVPVSDPGVAA